MLPCDIFDLRKNRLVPTKERLPLVVLRQVQTLFRGLHYPTGLFIASGDSSSRSRTKRAYVRGFEPLVRRLFLCYEELTLIVENLKCCCPEWLSERERLDLPCGSQESVEDIPCCECCWFMPVSEDSI